MRISDCSSDVCSSDLSSLSKGTSLPPATIEKRTTTLEALSRVWRVTALVGWLPTHPFDRQLAVAFLALGDVALGEFQIVEKDRKSVVEGKSVSVSVDIGGRRRLNKKKHKERKD